MSSTTEETNLINIYKEMYILNNNQIAALTQMQQTILQKLNTLAQRQQPAAMYLYTRASEAPQTRREEDITTTTFSDFSDPINAECPITFERFESTSNVSRINLCGHIFSQPALTSWLSTNDTCPVCRLDLGRRARRQRPWSLFNSLTDQILSRIFEDISSNVIDVSGNVVLDGVTLL